MGNNSRPETIVIINCVLNAPLMLISIIRNTLVLAAILRTPSLRSPSMILLFTLAVSDLLVGIVVQPIYVAARLTENGLLSKAMFVMVASVSGGSLLIMTAISVDRFLALHYHMRYPNLMTTQRAMYTSVVLCLISFLQSSLSFWKMDSYYFAAAASIVLCLIVSTFCYITIYRVVRRHQLQIHVQQQAVESNVEVVNQSIRRSTRSAKNTFIYYIVMILCYTPWITSLLISAIFPTQWTKALILADTAAFMNSSINPFLYCWRLRELRAAVTKTARQMICKETEQN
ncbi:melanocyte-stimulating hormone receptor-like [Oculina patagonica]